MDISYLICERTTLTQFCELLDTNIPVLTASIIYDMQLLRSHFSELLTESDCQIIVVLLLPIGLFFVHKLIQWMMVNLEDISKDNYTEECLRHMLCSVATTLELSGYK